MPGWNFADVWEVIAEQIPDAGTGARRPGPRGRVRPGSDGVAAPC